MAISERDRSLRGKQPSKKNKSPQVAAPNWFRLGYLIHDVSRMRRTLYDQHMKPLGITRSQWWVLANLSRRTGERDIISSELAKLLDISKVTLGRLIDRLEAAGYVRRQDDESDRRVKHVIITDAGYALIGRMRVITQQLNEKICVGLTEVEIKSTEQNLIRLKYNLRDMLAQTDTSDDDM